MKPQYHAESSAQRFGGLADDYIAIHNLMDNTKSAFGDNRHRAIWHSAYGIFAIEKIFGVNYSKLEKLKEKHQWTDEEVADILAFKQDTDTGTSIKNKDLPINGSSPNVCEDVVVLISDPQELTFNLYVEE